MGLQHFDYSNVLGKEWKWIRNCVFCSICLMVAMTKLQNQMLNLTLSPYSNSPHYPSFDKFNQMVHMNYQHWCSGNSTDNPLLLNGTWSCTIGCTENSHEMCPLTGPGPHSGWIGNLAAALEWSLLIVNALPCIYTLTTEFDETLTKRNIGLFQMQRVTSQNHNNRLLQH